MRLARLVVILSVAAACEPGISLTGGGSGGTGVSATLQTEMATAMQDELEGLVSAAVVPGNGTPIGTTLPAGCPTVSSTADADQDSIPTDAVYSFASPPCDIAGFLGGTLSLSGTVEIRDSSGTDTTTFEVTQDTMTWDYTDPTASRTYKAVRTGTEGVSVDFDAITIGFDLQTLRTRPAFTATETLDLTGSLLFTSAVPDSLVLWEPLPLGTISVDGSFHWRRSTENYTLTISTPTPITYDPSCTGTPDQFTDGEMDLVGTIQGVDGTLILTWSGCGADPTRSWVPN
jgi:hypothetical protein